MGAEEGSLPRQAPIYPCPACPSPSLDGFKEPPEQAAELMNHYPVLPPAHSPSTCRQVLLAAAAKVGPGRG